MAHSFRQREIIEVARRDGRVTVDGLADRFGVTLQTIRRDLTDLAGAGRLERVHGGAVLPSGIVNLEYEDRRTLNHAGKADIARACAAELPENCSIFLNIGTTTEAVAAELLDHRDLMVVTNNMNVATILAGNPECQVVVTGGTLRRSDGGLVGDLTTETIRGFKFDFAVIGCSALDADGDLLDFDVQEVGVSRAIIQQSRQVLVVADHTKLQRHAPVRIGSLADVDALLTDMPVDPRLETACSDWGTRIVVCGP